MIRDGSLPISPTYRSWRPIGENDYSRPMWLGGGMGKQLDPLTTMGTIKSCDAFSSKCLGECRRKRFRSSEHDHPENSHDCCRAPSFWNFVGDGAKRGQPTGGQRPVAGGGWAGGWWYGGAPVYGYRQLYGYYPHYRH